MGCSPWGHKGLDTTERLSTHTHTHTHTPLTPESSHMLAPSAQSLISPSLLNSILSSDVN